MVVSKWTIKHSRFGLGWSQ